MKNKYTRQFFPVLISIIFLLFNQACTIGPESLVKNKDAHSIALNMNKQSMQSSALTFVDSPSKFNTGKSPDSVIKEADWTYKNKRWDVAAALYQEVLERDPNNAYAWFRLGNCYTRRGQYSQAVLSFETSLQHQSEQSKPWFNLSTAHLLGAHLATLRALESLPPNDSKRAAIEQRLTTLRGLLP